MLVAKQAASIAVLTDNRLRLGVGISPWPEDFAAMGLPWEKRGVRMDETIDIVRGLTAGGWFEYDGELMDGRSMQDLRRSRASRSRSSSAATPRRRCGGPRNGATAGSTRGGDAAELAEMIPRVQRAARASTDASTSRSRSTRCRSTRTRPTACAGSRTLGVTDVIVGFRWPYVREPDTQPLDDKIAPCAGSART